MEVRQLIMQADGIRQGLNMTQAEWSRRSGFDEFGKIVSNMFRRGNCKMSVFTQLLKPLGYELIISKRESAWIRDDHYKAGKEGMNEMLSIEKAACGVQSEKPMYRIIEIGQDRSTVAVVDGMLKAGVLLRFLKGSQLSRPEYDLAINTMKGIDAEDPPQNAGRDK